MHKLFAPFTEHPATVGETYTEHFGVATSFGVTLILAGFACLVHAVFPFLFTTTGRRTIESLHRRMVTHRQVAVPLLSRGTSSRG
jgi:hypothetical protein